MEIRLENGEDRAAVRAVNEAAFGHPDEAGLVDQLREVEAVVVLSDHERILDKRGLSPFAGHPCIEWVQLGAKEGLQRVLDGIGPASCGAKL